MVGPVWLVRPREQQLIDGQQIHLVYDEIQTHVEEDQPAKVVLSFKQVSKCSTGAIGGLMRLNRLIEGYGGQLKLSVTPGIREMFEVTDLEGRVFALYDTESDAIAAFFEHGGDLFD